MLNCPDATVYFASSGSDLVYYPLIFQSLLSKQPILNCVTRPLELGSGSVLAAEGRYFSEWNQKGDPMPKGEGVCSEITPTTLTFTARNAQGQANPLREQIKKAFQKYPHHAKIGNLVCGSKSGLSDDLSLIDEHPDVLWVVDLCQLRHDLSLVSTLLQKGACVMITGSKFFQAPPFCGALLVPEQLQAQLLKQDKHIFNAFHKLFSLYDLPANMRSEVKLEPFENTSLHLRWACALSEMKAYAELDSAQVSAAISDWRQMVTQEFKRYDQRFIIMPDAQKSHPSIVSFQIRQNQRNLNYDELKTLFESIAFPHYPTQEGFQNLFLGQPVRYANQAFLRLALGSHNIRQLLQNREAEYQNDKYLIALIAQKAAAFS